MKHSKAIEIITEYERENNHSWYDELYRRNKDTLEDIALFYRGNSISYKFVFERMRRLACAMQGIGVTKGTEIPVCLSNSPELVYVMGAASMLGAVINVFSAFFPLDYIETILKNCDSCVGFFEDNYFAKLHATADASGLKLCVLCSLSDSLPEGNNLAKTVEGKQSVSFTSTVKELTSKNPHAVWFYDFLQGGEQEPVIFETVTLEDEFSVTYTSGSTNALRPKAIVQRVRSFCVIGRFHDPDIMHGVKFKKIRGLAIIPPYSNTDLISSISDTLMQGAVLAMEPVYNEHFFLDALLLNKPNFVCATRSFWITAIKRLNAEEKYRNSKLPFLLFAFVVGEELNRNEERFLNRGLRKADGGRDFHHLPLSPLCFSVAGGDCEHGSILYRLFRAASNFSLKPSSERRYGMTPFDFVEVTVLDPEGNRLGPNQVGRLAANSPCTMKCYKNDPESTKEFFVTDNNGRVWGDMSVCGYIDKRGKVYMRNRILGGDKSVQPLFKVADEILKSKAILSCEVVCTGMQYIAHVEFVPNQHKNLETELRHAKQRCECRFGKNFLGNLLFRVHSGTASFALTRSGKRDIKALIAEGTQGAVRV